MGRHVEGYHLGGEIDHHWGEACTALTGTTGTRAWDVVTFVGVHCVVGSLVGRNGRSDQGI